MVKSVLLRISTQSLRNISIARFHLLLLCCLTTTTTKAAPGNSFSKVQTLLTHLLQVASFSTPCVQIRPKSKHLSRVYFSTFLRFLSHIKLVSLRLYTLAPNVPTWISTPVQSRVSITQFPAWANATSRHFHRICYLREWHARHIWLHRFVKATDKYYLGIYINAEAKKRERRKFLSFFFLRAHTNKDKRASEELFVLL